MSRDLSTSFRLQGTSVETLASKPRTVVWWTLSPQFTYSGLLDSAMPITAAAAAEPATTPAPSTAAAPSASSTRSTAVVRNGWDHTSRSLGDESGVCR